MSPPTSFANARARHMVFMALVMAGLGGPVTAHAAEDAQTIGPALDRSADLQGPDANHNGIRDDIDAYIATQSYTPAQQSAARQFARAIQTAVTLNTSDQSAVRPAARALSRATECVFSRFSEPQAGYTVTSTYEKLTANTEVRWRSYAKFNHGMNGSVSSLSRGDTCDKE